MDVQAYDIDAVKEQMKDQALQYQVAMMRKCDCPFQHIDVFRVNQMCLDELKFFIDDKDGNWLIVSEQIYVTDTESDETELGVAFHIARDNQIEVTVLPPFGATLADVPVMLYILAQNMKDKLKKEAN